MKRCYVVVAIMLGVLLAGCAGKGNRGEVTLHLSNWGGADDDPVYARKIDGLYRQFERENPGIRLEIESVPDEYVQKMILSFVAGTAPDVLSLDASSAGVFINNGVLQDLSPLAAGDPTFKASDYWANVLAIDQRGKALYAVPGDFTPLVLYYNKKLFDRAHVPYPSGVWTFQQFLEVARKLTLRDSSGRVIQYGYNFTNWMPGWIVWLWNNGGDVLTPDGGRAKGALDSPQNVASITFLRDLVLKEKVSPDLSQTAATGVDPFGNGQTAMEISGHWELTSFKTAPKLKLSDVGVAQAPTNLPKGRTVMYEVGFAIPKQARHPKESWKLIKYLTGHLYQQAYQQTGIAVCGRKDVANERATDPREQQFLNLVPTARGPWGAQVVGYDFVEQEGKKMMERVLAGTDPKQALSEMADRIDSYFKVR
ncbi:MAG: sugar ABC transporter substrate-binding protein [Fimbriimonas sp.]|nr:sugar ABC transporter substrate-binding protein [Fimbriimonas sp.]